MSAASGTFLKGVVAYVDVYTAEGDEAGGTFVSMLKRCGARVLVKKPTEACTHIIYKSGRPSTANFVRRLDPDKRPRVVGIKWVTRCAELRTWVKEDDYAVNLDKEDVFVARKKNMQPKAVREEAPGGVLGGGAGVGGRPTGAGGGLGLGGLNGQPQGLGLGAAKVPKLAVRAPPRGNLYAREL